ncbi:hypothetical protein DYGSA30_36510 [Dyella sp. GSA-30]|nr:hypothetical protein DYGSA30_36510 [Dyella sp. GSA-30]
MDSVGQAAERFGLFPSEDIYVEIDAEMARSVLKEVFAYDMPHHLEMMPPERAKTLASAFVDAFAGEGATYFSNGDFGRWGAANLPEGMILASTAMQATEATFEVGVLVITPHRIACAWVMDED